MYKMNVIQDSKKGMYNKKVPKTTRRKLSKSKITGLRTLGEWISHRYIMKQLKHK